MNETIQKKFPVQGLGCAACAARVSKVLNAHKGVKEAGVNLGTNTALVTYSPSECSAEELRESVRKAGYDLIIDVEEDHEAEKAEESETQRYKSLRRRTGYAILLSIIVMLINVFFAEYTAAKYAMWILSSISLGWLGRSFFSHAWKLLKHGSASMDTLISCSTGIAYLFSLFNLFFPDFWIRRGVQPNVYFETVSMIISFILLGRLLEERAKGNTSTALKKLIGLRPKEVVRITPSGLEETIAVEQIAEGDELIIKPGEKIAVDGIVTQGSSSIDESMISGEPVPVWKEPNSKVFAGTINQKGSFRIRAEKVGKQTMLAQIIRLVENAQASKAPVQKLADRVAGIFVPVVLCFSVLTFALWMILSPDNGFTYGLLSAVTILIVACPCALGLATPTAVMVGVGKGAENGILIKDADSIETAQKIDTIVLDKTGTITEGTPKVTNCTWKDSTPQSPNLFFSLESLSEHPLATAITCWLKAEKVTPSSFQSITGQGVSGVFDGETYFAGNRGLLTERNIHIDNQLQESYEQMTANGCSTVWFANAHEALAVVSVSDSVKETSKAAIAQLQRQGMEIHILTGDNPAATAAISRKVGVTNWHAEMLPTQKIAFIKELQQQGKHVAMVGDGINDSAALAQADLSIAMGKGSDIAIDVSKITIISSDLQKISSAIRLSSLTMRTIRQNLFWAFIYNIIAIPVAAGILYPVCGFLLNPVIAGAAMAMSSVSVVTNSLRLKNKRIE